MTQWSYIRMAVCVTLVTMTSCKLGPETVTWAPISTFGGQVDVDASDGELVVLSWVISLRGLQDTVTGEVPFESRRVTAATATPDRVDEGRFRLSLEAPPPNDAFLPVAPDGHIEFGEAVGRVAFGSLALFTTSGHPNVFDWSGVDAETVELVKEETRYLVVWWDGGPIAAPDEWYGALERGPNLVWQAEEEGESHLVPLDTVILIEDGEETLGYDACGNTVVDQVTIDAGRSEYDYPGEDAYAWCTLYGTTLTHLVCERVFDALCRFCRVEVTTLAFGVEPHEEQEWYCSDVLAAQEGMECDPDEFVSDDFPPEDFADVALGCSRGRLYVCQDRQLWEVGDGQCGADCGDCLGDVDGLEEAEGHEDAEDPDDGGDRE